MKKILKKHFIPNEENDYDPHFFRKASVIVMAVVIFLFFFVSVFQFVAITHINLASIISSVLVDLANQDRIANNTTPLKINPLLTEAARLKAEDMASKGYFAHTSPEGVKPWDWFLEVGYLYYYAGENLAVNFSDSENVEKAWMESPTHRDNILKEDFTEIGIATAKGIYKGRETIFVVQMFGRPRMAFASLPEPQSSVDSAPQTSQTVVNIEVLSETDTFISAKSEEEEVIPPSEAPASPPESYASVAENILVSPKRNLNYIYGFISAIILGALMLAIFVEVRRHHYRHIAYASALIFLMAVLVYANQIFIVSRLIVG